MQGWLADYRLAWCLFVVLSGLMLGACAPLFLLQALALLGLFLVLLLPLLWLAFPLAGWRAPLLRLVKYGLLFVLALLLSMQRITALNLVPAAIAGSSSLVVQGRIINLSRSDEKWRLVVEVKRHWAGFDKGAPGVTATWLALKPYRLQLDWYQQGFTPLALQACGYWQFAIKIKPQRDVVNVGGRSWLQALLVQRVAARGVIKSGVELAPRFGSQLTKAYCGLQRQRQNWLDALAQDLQGLAYGGFFRALLLGDRKGFTPANWLLLRQTGTVHLFVVSGLHIALLAGFSWYLLKGVLFALLYSKGRVRQGKDFVIYRQYAWQRCINGWPSLVLLAGLSFIVCAAYALFSGFALPAQRALLMLALLFVGRISGGSWPWFGALGLSLIVILVQNPLLLVSLSLQLSFAAVLVILLLNISRYQALATIDIEPKPGALAQAGGVTWQSLCSKGLLKLKLLLRFQVLLSVFMALLLALQSQSLTFAVVWINVLLVPVFAVLILPCCLLAFACWLVGFSELALSIFTNLDLVLALIFEWAQQIVDVFKSWPLVPVLDWWQFMLALMAWLMLLLPLKGLRVVAFAVMALLYFSAAQPHPQQRYQPGEFSLYTFDVGQGLAMLVKTQRHQLLYDTAYGRGGFSMAQWVLLPSFKRLGLSRLDALVVSHNDIDHSGGMLAIYEAMLPTKLYLGQSLNAQSYLALQALDSAAMKASDHAFCHRQHWIWDGLEFEFLSADASLYKASDNNSSCVLRIHESKSGMTILLLGDIHKDKEQALMDANPNLQADVLSVAHHGSRTSSGVKFVGQVKAKYALVSAAYRHRFGHPHSEVVRRWHGSEAQVLNTAELGMVRVDYRHAKGLSWYSQRIDQKPWRPWYWDFYDLDLR